MIEKVVPMKEIKVALLQLLCRNNSKRPSFEEFLTFDEEIIRKLRMTSIDDYALPCVTPPASAFAVEPHLVFMPLRLEKLQKSNKKKGKVEINDFELIRIC